MKLRIEEAIRKGGGILIENPVIFVPAIGLGILSIAFLFFTVPFPRLTEITRFSLTMILFVILLLVGLFLSGMIIKMSYDATKVSASLSGSARFVAQKYGTLLKASIIFGFVVFLCSIPLLISWMFVIAKSFYVFIIPLVGSVILVVFLVIKLIFYGYAILIDESRAINSLKKSWNITKGKGNWCKVFVIALFFWILKEIPRGLASMLPLNVLAILMFFIIMLVTPWFYSSLTFAYIKLEEAVV